MFEAIDTTLGGNIAKLNWTHFKDTQEDYVEIQLPLQWKRGNINHGVYAIQKRNPDAGSKNPHADIVFDSEGEAKNFCTSLQTLEHVARGGNEDDEKKSDIYVSEKASWSFGTSTSVIAVPYWIAFDKKSESDSKGISTKQKRYMFCDNPWGWKPDPTKGNGDEDESKGIRSSKWTKDEQSNKVYEVTCMEKDKNNIPKTATFKFNGVLPYPIGHAFHYTWEWVGESGRRGFATLKGVPGAPSDPYSVDISMHQFNKDLGAAYCPVY